MALPSPSRLAIGALIRLYLVPRPPGDPESVAALQGGPVVEALTAGSTALGGGGGSLTPEQVRPIDRSIGCSG
jgi:hypothetical protein